MDVINHGYQRAWPNHVAVVSTSGLPEGSFLSVSAPPSDLLQPVRRIVLKKLNRPLGGRSFDGSQDFSDFCVVGSRRDEQMNMIGHHHISPQLKIQMQSGLLNRFGQPLASPVRFEKRKSSIAGESQLVSMALFMK